MFFWTSIKARKVLSLSGRESFFCKISFSFINMKNSFHVKKKGFIVTHLIVLWSYAFILKQLGFIFWFFGLLEITIWTITFYFGVFINLNDKYLFYFLPPFWLITLSIQEILTLDLKLKMIPNSMDCGIFHWNNDKNVVLINLTFLRLFLKCFKV